MSELKRCPTPRKNAYSTQTEAIIAMRAIAAKGRSSVCGPYKCRCGRWHLTSGKKGRARV